jgi:hypothetical protein
LEKVVVLVTLSTTKLGLQFLDFSTIFNRFFEVPAKTHQCLKNLFANRTSERLKPHNHTLSLRKTPQKEFNLRNAALGPWGRRGWLKFGGLASGLGQGRGWGGSRVREGPACVRIRGGMAAGERRGRDRAAVSAGGFAPVTLRLLTVYFGAPSMFITLWFGFDYETNPPLGTLII